MNMHCHLDSMICRCSGPDCALLIFLLFGQNITFVSNGGEIALYGQNPQINIRNVSPMRLQNPISFDFFQLLWRGGGGNYGFSKFERSSDH